MKKPFAAMFALVLLGSLLPGVRLASPQVASAHAEPPPPTPPSPTSSVVTPVFSAPVEVAGTDGFVYVHSGNIWLTDTAGQFQRQLTFGGHDSSPALSPGGNLVAYLSVPPQYLGSAPVPQDVCVVDILTGSSTCLTDEPASRGSPVWSPDGDWLAYAEGKELVLIRADGSGRRVIATGLASDGPLLATLAWSPDGDTLACVLDEGGDTAVWLVDVSAGPTRRLMRLEQYTGTPLEFSPDGRLIAVVNAYDKGRLWAIPLDGSEPMPLEGTGSLVYDFSWSPSGDEMVYSRTDGSVWILVLRTGIPHRVRTAQEPPPEVKWASNGERILLTFSGSDGTSLTILSPRDGQELRLTPSTPTNDLRVEGSPSPLGDIPAPFEWYRYQGEWDSGACNYNNCGPTAVAMAIQFAHNNQWVSISDIRTYISGSDCRWTNLYDLGSALSHWGVAYTTITGMDAVRDAVNSRGHIVIAPVWMSYIPAGSDYLSSYSDPASHYNRYYSYDSGHIVVVKGISSDNNWVIVHDPNVWDGNGIYWYSDYTAKGRSRYYGYSNFASAFANNGNQAIEILEVPGGSDTTDPDGDITSPSEGATISSRTVHLAGWAQDNAGGSGFNHAHFTAYYNGSWRQVGPDFTSSPFGFDWDMCDAGVPDGSVTIGLDIWDNAGNEANSPHGVRHITKSYACGGPPSPEHSIQLYKDANYGGGGYCYGDDEGYYNDLDGCPGYNDQVSSLLLKSGWSVRVFKDANLGGTSRCFTSSDSDFANDTFDDGSPLNDQMSSLALYHQSSCPPLVTPPSAPSLQSPGNGTVFNEGQGINLSWSATGNEYYGEIWGGPAGTLTFGWQSGTSRDIGSQWAGYTYSWHVKARNGAGESGWSSAWTFTVRPAAPSSLTAQATSCSQVNLSWNDNSGNEEGYKIYRNGIYVGQVGMNVASYQDPGLSGSTTYSYYVKAFRGGIESNSSNTVNITTPPCAAPKPDLRPYTLSGYPAPVVPSSIPGTHVANTLYAGHPTYFDWHFTNGGGATASGNFHVELWVDNTRYVRYPYSDYAAGRVGGFDDWAETIPTAGWRTVRLVADPDNTIAESDEGNNIWEQSFYWSPVTGWWGEYFNNTALSGPPALVRDDPDIDFDWGNDAPGPGVNADSFSVRWTRAITFSQGIYQFAMTHDDGARLWVDGVLALDQWATCCRTDTAEAFLAGGAHSLRMEMMDTGGAAVARLRWWKVSWEMYLPLVKRGS